MYEQNQIKKIYQHAGKCDDQQNLKDIIDAAILSTPEGVIYHSPNVHFTSAYVDKNQLEHKDSTEIQNKSDISSTDDIHSCVIPRKQNISFHATSTTPCLTLAASIKRNVCTLPTYRCHPPIYTKYHLRLQKNNKNNNKEYLILM